MTSPFARLAALAEAATPGPWFSDGWVVYAGEQDEPSMFLELGGSEKETGPDAEFIAAADPSTVLALVRVAEAAGQYRKFVRPYQFRAGSELGAHLDAALAALSVGQEGGTDV